MPFSILIDLCEVSETNFKVRSEPKRPKPCTVVNLESNVKSSLGKTTVKIVPEKIGIGFYTSILKVAYSCTVSLLAVTFEVVRSVDVRVKKVIVFSSTVAIWLGVMVLTFMIRAVKL